MTTVTTNISLQSPIVELFPLKNDIQMLIKFLDTKGFRSDTTNVPTYERLVVLLNSIGTHVGKN